MDNDDVVGDDEYLDEFSSEEDAIDEFDDEIENRNNDVNTKNIEIENGKKEQKEREKKEIYLFELSEEVLNIHQKNINEIRIILNGHKLAIAGNDNILRIFDFRKMNKLEKHYTSSIGFAEGSIIQSFDTNKNLLVIGNGNKCYVYDDNLKLIKNTIRGDMYIKDCKNTKGHTKGVNCCKFHPRNSQIFISGSLDSTVRIWNLETMKCYGIDNELVHHQCLKICNEKHYVTNHVLCANFNKEGNSIIIGCDNGQIEIRNKISNDYNFSHKADVLLKKGLFHNGDITDILSSQKKEYLFFSRSVDNTIKKWDLRNLKGPVNSIENVHTIMGKSNICFCKDEKYIVVGTQEKEILKKEEEYKNIEHGTKEYIQSVLDIDGMKAVNEKENKKIVEQFIKIYKGDEDMNKYLTEIAMKPKKKKEFSGTVQIYDVDNLNLVFDKKYDQLGIICTYYDDYMNHLFLGTTEGTCIIYYDQNDSKQGVMQYLSKTIKRKIDTSFYVNNDIVIDNVDNLPKGLKITRSGDIYIKKREIYNNNNNTKEKMNPSVTAFSRNAYERKPHVAAYSNYMIDKIDKKENTNNCKSRDADNIVEVLREREKNKKGTDYFLKAYEETQPKRIIDYESDVYLEYSEYLKVQKCPQCGIKNCVCGFSKK